jgi:hypothetical protein
MFPRRALLGVASRIMSAAAVTTVAARTGSDVSGIASTRYLSARALCHAGA